MFSICTLKAEPNVLQLHKGSTYIAKPPFTKPPFVNSRSVRTDTFSFRASMRIPASTSTSPSKRYDLTIVIVRCCVCTPHVFIATDSIGVACREALCFKIHLRGCSGNRVEWFTLYYRLFYYIILPPSTATPLPLHPPLMSAHQRWVNEYECQHIYIYIYICIWKEMIYICCRRAPCSARPRQSTTSSGSRSPRVRSR